MILIPNFKTLSLEQLNSSYRHTLRKSKAATGGMAIVYSYILQLYTKEFERRADLIPTPLLMDLINSGLTFSFNPKAKQ